jgi:hypothetical protein
MARVRISTTVDAELLATARGTRSELADSALIDEALDVLLDDPPSGAERRSCRRSESTSDRSPPALFVLCAAWIAYSCSGPIDLQVDPTARLDAAAHDPCNLFHPCTEVALYR